MNRTRWIVFGAVCFAALLWLVVAARKDAINVSNVDPFILQTEGAWTDNVYGNKNAKVTLYEYGDFQCSGCGSAYPVVSQVKEKYKDQIAFVFRHFPLTNSHPNALAAATVAEAAGEQGKFWEMHDLLFENQNAWKNSSAQNRTQIFEGYAGQLGLNMDKFRNDLQNESVNEKISFDRAIGKKLNVNSTPTFFLNGKQLQVTDWNQEGALEKKITDALKAEGVTLPTETAETVLPQEEPTDTQQ